MVSPLPAYSPGGMLNAFAWPLTCSDQQRASIVYRADYQGIHHGNPDGEFPSRAHPELSPDYTPDYIIYIGDTLVSKALRAYAQSVSSADKGGVRIID